MRKQLQGFTLGVLLYFLFVSGITFASNLQKEIDVTYRDVKLAIDENEVIPRDVNGNVVEPFIYNGTTYLPVRAVGEALGRDVSWDNDTSTVHINEKRTKEIYLFDTTPIQTSEKTDYYKDADEESKYIGVAPVKSLQTMDIYGWRNFKFRVIYSLNGRADRVIGTIMPPVVPEKRYGGFRVEIRNEKGTLVYKSDYLDYNSKPIDFEVSTKDFKNLMVDFIGSTSAYSDTCKCMIKNLLIHVTE